MHTPRRRQGRAVQRRNHRLRARFDATQHLEQQGRHGCTLELAQVRAGHEVASDAVQHDGTHRVVRIDTLDRRQQGPRAPAPRRRLTGGFSMTITATSPAVSTRTNSLMPAGLHTRSSSSAMPCPTPMHIVHSARRAPDTSSWLRAVATRRAPLAPSGCPDRDRTAVRIHVRGIVRKPELAHHGQRLRGKGFVELEHIDVRKTQLVFSSSLRVAGTGPIPMIRGATPATALATMRARGSSPFFAAARSLAIRSAAAPSLTARKSYRR
jgi:hypothetical protein